MTKFRFIISVVTVTLSGCHGPFVPVQTLDKVGISTIFAASKIQTVSHDQANTMHSLGQVVGYSCQNRAFVEELPSSRIGAIDQLKIVAAQRGAIAITEPQCEEGGFSLIKNCYNSWECESTALTR